MAELVVKSFNFGVMQFDTKKPRYIPPPVEQPSGNVFNAPVIGGETPAPPPPVVNYPTSTESGIVMAGNPSDGTSAAPSSTE